MAKEVASGGAPLTPRHRIREVVSSGDSTWARFRSCFPDVSLTQCYGQTEAGILTMCDLQSLLHNNHPLSLSIGRLVPCAEARIVDVNSGVAFPPNRTGELWIRGPSAMQGYLRNKEATVAALVRHPEDAAPWLRTGDLCYVDSPGFLHLVDRLNELIKYKAYQVAPAELEDVLAVAPYPDEEAREIPMACVVRKPDLQAQDVISFLKHKVAPYKMIRKVVFVDCVPRPPSGKILRAQLKSFLRTGTGATQGGVLQSATPAAPRIGSPKL